MTETREDILKEWFSKMHIDGNFGAIHVDTDEWDERKWMEFWIRNNNNSACWILLWH